MSSFQYLAVNSLGQRIKGSITADNEADLETRLRQAGLDLISAKESGQKRSWSPFNKIGMRSLILFCMHLEQLVRAGVPLHEALADIRDTTSHAKFRDVLTSIFESVKNGNMLSIAFGEHPRVFNSVFVGLVAAGEKTGRLSEAFHHLGDHLKWVSEIRRKLKKAIRYPIFMLLMLSSVIGVLMTFVVPKLIDFIMAQGFTIPWHTRALIGLSRAFQNYGIVIVSVPVLLIILILVLYRKIPSFAYRLDSLLLKLPVIGSVIRKIEIARFTHFFAVMFNSGIDILEALTHSRDVVHNRVIRESVEDVRNQVTNGTPMHVALKLSTQFPVLVVRMFKIGEDSGNMREALDNVNFFYEREVNDSVETMVGIVQPALTIVMGLLLFWIISAVFGPLYDSLSKMKF